ncbi:MAG: hypothetical protein U5K75_11105 [Ahrensia sp.]|nr:hypothetical protein [Ahrensia sp.]
MTYLADMRAMTEKVDEIARDLLADAIEGQGPLWQNAARSVRAGFSNVWIIPALQAITRALTETIEDDG